jgi:hypothetical protein
MASIGKAGASKKVISKKILTGIRAMDIYMTFGTFAFSPDATVSGLVLWYKMTVQA